MGRPRAYSPDRPANVLRQARRWGGLVFAATLLALLPAAARPAGADGPVGYYRQPALAGDTVYFVAEGDIWRVPATGGRAARVTSNPGPEDQPAVSPDGGTLAFVAAYEGPSEVYTMPAAGGLPVRRTWLGAKKISVEGFLPDGRLLVATDAFSGLPQVQLLAIPPTGAPVTPDFLLPLAQASEGCSDDKGEAVYFTRLPFQGSHTKRYRGGTAQQIWAYRPGDSEARPLSGDYPGTSRNPMWWQGRLYFVSDRDGALNVWSMDPSGQDLRQHTRHKGWDVLGPSLDRGRIVYQLGADLRLLDLATGEDRLIPVTLSSDLDQVRVQRIDRPMEYLTSAHLSPNGDRVALTARGVVFSAPCGQGRLAQVTRKNGVRFRSARFMPDGKNILALSDESGETEFWLLPANGDGFGKPLSSGADVLRWDGLPSPDGKMVAHTDKNQRLWVLDTAAGTSRLIETSTIGDIEDLAWSPDSRWLAYVSPARNTFRVVRVWNAATGTVSALTSDRYDHSSPAWSPDGKWLYMLSGRNMATSVPSPWGYYAPQPDIDRPTRICLLPLTADRRSPFAPRDELQNLPVPVKDEPAKPAAEEAKTAPAKAAAPPVVILLDGIVDRLMEAPVPPGRYTGLAVTDKALFWVAVNPGDGKRLVQSISIAPENAEVATVLTDVKDMELSADRKKLLLRKGNGLWVVDAEHGAAKLEKRDVPLSDWTLRLDPREEWRQMFVEAWRLERDYFYDPAMHGVSWKAMLEKYKPLAERVLSRWDLSDLISQMVAELSALHTFVYGGDLGKSDDRFAPASLGADLVRDEAAGGCRVTRLRPTDPNETAQRPPLAQPEVDVREGDLVETINGVSVLSVPDPAALLLDQAGKQVLLRLRPAGGGAARNVVVRPVTAAQDADLRYAAWEYGCRREVEKRGGGRIGYVHLRAMGSSDYAQWARDFFPVFDREGLIVDVRHNRGGNIDSWILSQLLRKAWFHWSSRVGDRPDWNMQYAFRGHLVVLCDEFTASDGEAFAEGFRRLGLGKIIGTRTWGGEIWLSSDNFLVDGGIATAAETGVFGPEGKWLIEGWGVEPDQTVDNLPHETFGGRDAQLEAAVAHLLARMKESPVVPVVTPPKPDKSFP